MIFFDANDKASQAEFFLMMSEGLERIADPERYMLFRDTRTALEEFRDTTQEGSEERRAVNIAISNVREEMVRYEEADPVQIMNDMMNKVRS